MAKATGTITTTSPTMTETRPTPCQAFEAKEPEHSFVSEPLTQRLLPDESRNPPNHAISAPLSTPQDQPAHCRHVMDAILTPS